MEQEEAANQEAGPQPAAETPQPMQGRREVARTRRGGSARSRRGRPAKLNASARDAPPHSDVARSSPSWAWRRSGVAVPARSALRRPARGQARRRPTPSRPRAAGQRAGPRTTPPEGTPDHLRPAIDPRCRRAPSDVFAAQDPAHLTSRYPTPGAVHFLEHSGVIAYDRPSRRGRRSARDRLAPPLGERHAQRTASMAPLDELPTAPRSPTRRGTRLLTCPGHRRAQARTVARGS